MPRRAHALPAVLLLATLQTTGVAAAAWSTTSSGGSAAALDVLAPPTATAVTWDPVVHVSWAGSASPWATGYGVERSVSTSGPWTSVAEVGAGTTTVDDAPGADTHHYRVVARRDGWTSAPSEVATRADPTYVFKTSTAFSGTSCAAAAGGRFDMQQGWSTAGGTELSRRRSGGTFAFCTDTWTAGQTLPSGSTGVTAHVSNTNGASCLITFTLLVNGVTSLGSGVMTVTQGTRRPQSLSFGTGGHAFASGDRLQLRVSWDQTNACNDTYLYWGAAGSPSSLVLAG